VTLRRIHRVFVAAVQSLDLGPSYAAIRTYCGRVTLSMQLCRLVSFPKFPSIVFARLRLQFMRAGTGTDSCRSWNDIFGQSFDPKWGRKINKSPGPAYGRNRSGYLREDLTDNQHLGRRAA
jgi:hypothetical protein